MFDVKQWRDELAGKLPAKLRPGVGGKPKLKEA
jgi:hypothetical protein